MVCIRLCRGTARTACLTPRLAAARLAPPVETPPLHPRKPSLSVPPFAPIAAEQRQTEAGPESPGAVDDEAERDRERHERQRLTFQGRHHEPRNERRQHRAEQQRRGDDSPAVQVPQQGGEHHGPIRRPKTRARYRGDVTGGRSAAWGRYFELRPGRRRNSPIALTETRTARLGRRSPFHADKRPGPRRRAGSIRPLSEQPALALNPRHRSGVCAQPGTHRHECRGVQNP